jgi:hypothetical protein
MAKSRKNLNVLGDLHLEPSFVTVVPEIGGHPGVHNNLNVNSN